MRSPQAPHPGSASVSALREVSPRPQLHTLRFDVSSPRSVSARQEVRASRTIATPRGPSPHSATTVAPCSPRQPSSLPTAPSSRQLASRAAPGDLSWQSFKRSLGERVVAPVRPEPTWTQPAPVSRYDTASASRSPATQPLFPLGRDATCRCPLDQTTSRTVSERLGSLRKPHAVDQLGSLDGDVTRGTTSRAAHAAGRAWAAQPLDQPHGASRAAKAAGRARATQLADSLARDVGPDSWAQSRARGLFNRCDEFMLPAVQDELLKLTGADLFPHRSSVDEGMRVLAQQVGLQCEERGLLVEYMRRHYVDSLQVSTELLRILQGTLRTNKQLCAATDASLMQKFQETMRSMQPTVDPPVGASRAQISLA